MKRIFTLSIALIFFVLGKSFAAPLSGVYLVPGPGFPNLQTIIDTLNTYGVSGPVTVRLTTNQTAPSGGYVVGSSRLNPTLSSINTLTFVGWTAPAIASKTITAQTGSGNQDAIFTIQGAQYVTVNSFDLVESASNTTATSMMERGFAVVKFNKDTGTKKASFLNCNITLNNANTTAASGIAPLGSVGIFIGNCTYLSTTALGLAIAEDGTNDGTFISNCTIKNVNHGIYVQGIPVIADGTSFNDKNCTFTGNRIENFTHHGIYLSYSTGDLINGNVINNTASGGVAPTSNMLYGVRYANNNPVSLQTNTTWDCTNNNINLTINASSGTLAATGIYTQVFGTGATFIENDTIQIASIGTTAQINGIFSQNKFGSQRIANNLIRNFSTLTSNSQSVLGIYAGGYSTASSLGLVDLLSYPKSSIVTSNTVTNWDVSSGATALSIPNRVAAILEDNFDTATSTVTNNRISDIVINSQSVRFIGYGGVWSYGPFTAAPPSASAPKLHTTIFSGNSFNNISTSGVANATPLLIVHPLGTYPNGHTFLSSKNRISKLTSDLGLISAYTSDFCLLYSMQNDTVEGINSANWHAIGLLNAFTTINAAGNTYSSKTININGCLFSDIKSSSTAGGAFASGTHLQPGNTSGYQLTSATIKNNVINQLATSDVSGNAFGISSTGGSPTINIANNMISDIIASANTTAYSSSFGINLTNSGTNNIFYNTVKMVTSSTSGSAYGATGLAYSPGATNVIQNNVLHVNVTAGTDNNVSAIRSASGSASAPPSLTGFTASSNIYYTPNGPNNYLYVEGTTNNLLVNGYHTSGLTPNTTKNIVNDMFFNSECDKSSYHNFMKTTGTLVRESKTFTENNLTGTAGVFSPTGMSYAEASATDVAVSDDFMLNSRPFGGSDIGALEFAGTARPVMVITVTSSTGYDTACTFNLPVLTATIPAFFNRVSYQWYRDTNKIIGATTRSLLVTPISGNYIIKVYDSATGCEYPSDPYRMTIVPPPPAQITYYDSLTFCETSAIVLQANKGYNYTYRWMRNSTFMPGETNDHLVVDKSGDYMLEVNTPLGCASYSLPIRVKVYPLPTPTIIYGGPGKLSTQKYFTYQWYKNNIKIDSFAINRDYYTLYEGDGAYSVEVTDSNGCTAKSDVYLFATSIDENAVSGSIKIYPNPVVNELHINSPIVVNAKLTDVTGRVVLEQQEATILETSTLAEGMYLLTLTDKEGNLIKVAKITKTR